MTGSIDWTDTALRSLDELARIAFPPGAGVTADTLKRRARQGKLTVYRPGKAYVASLAGVWAMIQATRVQPRLSAGSEVGPSFSRRDVTARSTEAQASAMSKLDALRSVKKQK
jgi:hypothetical protein